MIVLAVIFAVCQTCAGYEFYYADSERKIRLYRPQPVINLAVSTSFKRASNIKSDRDILELIKKSSAVWENVADVRFQIKWTDEQSISSYESRGDKINLLTIGSTAENLSAFQADPKANGTTRLFYNKRGQIAETDIVINPLKPFSTDGTFGTFDLESTLTHEIGHLLGLDHAASLSSTMYSTQAINGFFSEPALSQRTLAQDDIAAVRSLYGAKNSFECCASFEGKIKLDREVKSATVWLENATDGRLTAVGETNAAGIFSFGGLPPGAYRLWAQPKSADSDIYLAENISVVNIGIEKTQVERNLPAADEQETSKTIREFALSVIPDKNPLSAVGINAQLSSSPILFKRGAVATLFALSAKDAEPDANILQFGSNSFINLGRGFFDRSFNEKNAALTSSFYIHDKVAVGEYTLYRKFPSGGSSALLGAVSVE